MPATVVAIIAEARAARRPGTVIAGVPPITCPYTSSAFFLLNVPGGACTSVGRTVSAVKVLQQDAKTAAALAAAADALQAYRAALNAELELMDERDRAIVAAIRAGARLEEAAEAAGISRAAVSKVARRTLPSRTGRGGPYSRRRGSSAALDRVAEVALLLVAARSFTREAKAPRDEAIAHAVARGAGVSETARVVGLTPASVSVIARAGGEGQATNVTGGAVASLTR